MQLFLEFPSWLTPQVAPWLPIRWYGLLYIAAFVVTIALFRHEAGRIGLTDSRDEVALFFAWTIAGVLVGGRVLYVVAIGPTAEYFAEPWRIVWPFSEGKFTGIQGMSYHGGLLGAAAATALFCKIHSRPLLQWADTLAVSAPLGYALGRVGNFINGELVGRVSVAPWGFLFPRARRVPIEEPWARRIAEHTGVEFQPYEMLVNLPRHPSQLYSALLEGVLLWLMLWFGFRRKRMFHGALTGLYVAGYGIARFIVGYFRAVDEGGLITIAGKPPLTHHAVASLTALSVDQFVSLAMILIGVAVLSVARVTRPALPYVSTYTE